MLVGQDYKKTTFTLNQVYQYFTKIGYYSNKNINKYCLPPCTYDTLVKLISLHIRAIPFGTLSLSYYKRYDQPISSSPPNPFDPYSTKGISLKLEDIFSKLILNDREGFCFEQNTLFLNILLYLGFDCMLVTSKVIDANKSSKIGITSAAGINHVSIIVKLEDKLYLVDVGFGSRAPVQPLEISNQKTLYVEGNIQHRIIQTNIKEEWYYESSISPKAYALQCKTINKQEAWKSLYLFTLTPCYPRDIEVLNFDICFHPNSPFVKHIMLSLYVEDGKVTLLDDKLTVYKDGHIDYQIILESEYRRRWAYKHYFNIDLPGDYQEALPPTFGTIIRDV